jgi:prepilin-type N-terminal cleavage/methylation domain-containing protein
MAETSGVRQTTHSRDDKCGRPEWRISSGRRRGYTLLEVLVSIAILSLMVVAVARIVTDMTRATKAGYRQAYNDANARAVLDMILDDLMQAVNEPSINVFSLGSGGTTYSGSFEAADLQFVAVLGPKLDTPAPSDYQKSTLKAVRYYMPTPKQDIDGNNIYALNRAEQWEWWKARNELITGDSSPVLEYMVEFRIDMYDENHQAITDLNGRLPSFLNVYFSVLSEDDHRRARRIQTQSGNAAMETYIRENAHRYFTQAYFPMRAGRKPEYNY